MFCNKSNTRSASKKPTVSYLLIPQTDVRKCKSKTDLHYGIEDCDLAINYYKTRGARVPGLVYDRKKALKSALGGFKSTFNRSYYDDTPSYEDDPEYWAHRG